jgi:RND family efflux transporter MFP subunit
MPMNLGWNFLKASSSGLDLRYWLGVALALVLILTIGNPVYAEPAAVPVTIRPLGDLLETAEYSAPASVEARNQAALSAEISARIQAIPVLIGDRVEPGDRIVQLDCRQYESQLSSARAGLAELQSHRRLAANQLQRARDLEKKRNVSEEVVDQRRTDLTSLAAQIRAQQAAIEQAELQVERCTIRAPFRATVLRRPAAVGEWATPGTPLIELVELDEREVSASLREAQLRALQEAATVHFEYLGQYYELTQRAVLPTVDPRTRTREIRLRFGGEPAPVGSGGRLIWRAEHSLLPAEYLVRRDDRLGVFVFNDRHARFLPLSQALEGQPVRVDLSADTRLIVDGRQRLEDGDRVAPADESSVATDAGPRD